MDQYVICLKLSIWILLILIYQILPANPEKPESLISLFSYFYQKLSLTEMLPAILSKSKPLRLAVRWSRCSRALTAIARMGSQSRETCPECIESWRRSE